MSTSVSSQKRDTWLNPSDTKGFGTTSDTKGGGGGGRKGRAEPLLYHNSLELGT